MALARSYVHPSVELTTAAEPSGATPRLKRDATASRRARSFSAEPTNGGVPSKTTRYDLFRFERMSYAHVVPGRPPRKEGATFPHRIADAASAYGGMFGMELALRANGSAAAAPATSRITACPTSTMLK